MHMMFSLNDKLEYSGFDQGYHDWIHDHKGTSIRIGDPWPGFEIKSENSLDRIKKAMRDVIRDKKSADDFELQTIYGHDIRCRSVMKVFDEKGKANGITFLLTLKSEKKAHNESEVRNSARTRGNEELYLSVINALQEGIVVQDRSGKIFLANDSAARILGLTKKQLLGKDSYDPRWKALKMDGSPLEGKDHPGMVSLQTGRPVSNFLMNVHVSAKSRRVISINSDPVKGIDEQMLGSVTSFTDVTQQIEIEKELKDSEERYRSLVENAPVGILLHLDGKIKIRNSFAARILEEKPKGALINKTFLDIVHPDYRDMVKERYGRLQRNETTKLEAIEEKLLTMKGRTVEVLKSGISINYKGRPAFVTVFSDISRIKKSENLIKRNEERISNLANSIPGALLQYKINTDGSEELPYISDQVIELWEVPKKQALKNVNKLWAPVLPEDLPGMQNSIRVSMEKMAFWDHEWRIKTKSGKIKWLNGRGIPKKLEDGSYLWDTLILDITKQKHTENRLLEINRQLELAVDSAKLGVWTYDIRQEILDWNDVILGIYNITREEFNNQVNGWTDKLHEADATRAFDEFQKLYEGKSVENIRFRIRPTPDTIRYILASGAPIINSDGQVIKLIGINIDITEFVEKEEKLQQALDAKNTLLKELHHRIKNNLNLISNLLYIKSKTTGDQNLIEYIKETKSRINTIAKTHDQLLKMEEFDQLDVKNYLEDLIVSLVTTYTTDGSNYPTTLEIEHVVLPVDRILILGLLTNEIMLNAIKYAYEPGAGGPIYLSLKKVKDEIEFVIRDEGKGIKTKNKDDQHSAGLDLINLLVQQLSGRMKQETQHGVKYVIEFPANTLSK